MSDYTNKGMTEMCKNMILDHITGNGEFPFSQCYIGLVGSTWAPLRLGLLQTPLYGKTPATFSPWGLGVYKNDELITFDIDNSPTLTYFVILNEDDVILYYTQFKSPAFSPSGFVLPYNNDDPSQVYVDFKLQPTTPDDTFKIYPGFIAIGLN